MNAQKLAALILTAVLLPAGAIAQRDGTSDPQAASEKSAVKDGSGTYAPNAGFKLVKTDMGEINLKIYSYIRYLNQMGLNESYINHYGTSTALDRRQDIQLNKVNIQFWGWLLDPKFRYLFYVWTNNTAQGLGAQVVVAGSLSYTFSQHFTLGGGVGALPGVRSTEGSFPFWLTNDNRYIADEFFRPSYTMGLWAKGAIVDGLMYNVMLGNNLSQLGIDAGQLDAHLSTISGALKWYPTTGEYGLNDNFGDFENHQEIATRLGVHYTRSPEDRQGQPDTEAFENVQIRISDGTVIFAPGVFGPGIQLDNATYNMAGLDAGAKYKGFSLEGEYYWRLVDDFRGRGVEDLTFDRLTDNGFQIQASGMIIRSTLQAYAGYSKVFGEYGDPWDLRFGLNYHPWKNHVVRFNLEYIHTEKSPVGGLSLPYQVGGTGDIVYANFEVNF
jgi:hypothetical protein